MAWADVIRDVLTVVGAIGGTLIGTWLVNRASRRARVEARMEAAAETVAELVECLDRHRAVMWRMMHRRLAGAAGLIPVDSAAADEDVTASHATRAAIGRQLTMLCLRAPTLAIDARSAAHATYAMHRAKRLVDLERRRVAALRASENLVDAAGHVFSPTALSA